MYVGTSTGDSPSTALESATQTNYLTPWQGGGEAALLLP